MATSRLSEDSEARLGAARLPAGRRIIPLDDLDRPLEPVAWGTSTLVPDPGHIWSALSDAQLLTGLVPVLLADEEDDADDFFEYPSDIAEVDHLDGAAVLQARWQDRVGSEAEEDAMPSLARERGPFSRYFPGLAPAEQAILSPARLHQVLAHCRRPGSARYRPVAPLMPFPPPGGPLSMTSASTTSTVRTRSLRRSGSPQSCVPGKTDSAPGC